MVGETSVTIRVGRETSVGRRLNRLYNRAGHFVETLHCGSYTKRGDSHGVQMFKQWLQQHHPMTHTVALLGAETTHNTTPDRRIVMD